MQAILYLLFTITLVSCEVHEYNTKVEFKGHTNRVYTTIEVLSPYFKLDMSFLREKQSDNMVHIIYSGDNVRDEEVSITTSKVAEVDNHGFSVLFSLRGTSVKYVQIVYQLEEAWYVKVTAWYAGKPYHIGNISYVNAPFKVKLVQSEISDIIDKQIEDVTCNGVECVRKYIWYITIIPILCVVIYMGRLLDKTYARLEYGKLPREHEL